MATIQITPSGRYRVQIRMKNQPYQSASFDTKGDALSWARQQESIIKASLPPGNDALFSRTFLTSARSIVGLY